MAINTVDKVKGFDIQKVTNQQGKVLRYQTVPAGGIGDASLIKEYPTLTGARAALATVDPQPTA